MLTADICKLTPSLATSLPAHRSPRPRDPGVRQLGDGEGTWNAQSGAGNPAEREEPKEFTSGGGPRENGAVRPHQMGCPPQGGGIAARQDRSSGIGERQQRDHVRAIPAFEALYPPAAKCAAVVVDQDWSVRRGRAWVR